MITDRRTVVGAAFDNGVCCDAAIRCTGNTVAVALREIAGIDKLSLLDRREVPALCQDLLQEQDGALFQLPHFAGQIPLFA